MGAFGISAFHPNLTRSHVLGYADDATSTQVFRVWAGAAGNTERFLVYQNGDVRIGPDVGAGLATTATGGFLTIQGGAGPPTGTPTHWESGVTMFYYDYTNHELFAYYDGTWRGASMGPANGYGGTGTGRVGTTREALPAQSTAVMAMVFALGGNSGDLFVGGSGVTNTTGSDNETTGISLDAGQATPWIPCDDLSDIYVIGSAANQDYTFVWLT